MCLQKLLAENTEKIFPSLSKNTAEKKESAKKKEERAIEKR